MMNLMSLRGMLKVTSSLSVYPLRLDWRSLLNAASETKVSRWGRDYYLSTQALCFTKTLPPMGVALPAYPRLVEDTQLAP
jgi:hypothetical protein